MNLDKFYSRLFGIAIVLWVASYVLNLYAAYYMVAIYKDMDNDMQNGNYTKAALTIVRNNVYETSRVEGIGGNIIFSIGVIYIMWHSFKYMDDLVPKLRHPCTNFFFLLGLALDVTGISLSATGFSKYGGSNPQEGTAYHTSGLFAILLGSFLVIRAGLREENAKKVIARIAERHNEAIQMENNQPYNNV
jgi:hypothetical protein